MKDSKLVEELSVKLAGFLSEEGVINSSVDRVGKTLEIGILRFLIDGGYGISLEEHLETRKRS